MRRKQKENSAANIQVKLLEAARKLSGLNETAAITERLAALIQREKRKRFLALEGKLVLDYPVEKVRGRDKFRETGLPPC
jgi:hypothetical protein